MVPQFLLVAAAFAATADIVSFLKSGTIERPREGCLHDAVELTVRAEVVPCGAAAKESFTHIIIKNNTCWGGRKFEPYAPDDDLGQRFNNSKIRCGRVFRLEEYPVEYDKLTPPRENEPTTVRLSATIIKLNNLDIKLQKYSYSMYFREEWNDPRLSWNPRDFGGQQEINRASTSASSVTPFMWTPDGFFSTATDVAKPDNEESFTVYCNGSVLWSRLQQITSFCEMNLKYYPFDFQECITDIESYSYNNRTLVYDLSLLYKHLHIDSNPETQCSGCSLDTIGAYKMSGIHAGLVTKKYRNVYFSGVRWRFHFTRGAITYMLTMFLPLWLICILSAGSCWIDNGAATARVGMGITTVLVLISQINGLKSHIAVVRYISGIDIYLLMCLMFCVMNVIEYGVLNFMMNKLQARGTDMEMKRKYITMRLEECPDHVRRDSLFGDAKLEFSDGGSDDEESTKPKPKQKSSRYAKLKRSFRRFARGGTDDSDTENVLTPVEDAYLRDCFEVFATHEDKIDSEKLRPLLLSMGIPDEHVIALVRDVRPHGSITYKRLAPEVKKLHIFEDYGVKATTFCGRGITMSSLTRFERVYRVAAVVVLVLFNVVWLIVLLILRNEAKNS